MKKKLKSYLTFTLSFALLFFVFAFIVTTPLWAQTQDTGLVPCTGSAGSNCDLGALITLFQKVIDFVLVGIAVPLSMALFAYAGFLYLTASGDSGQIEKGHKMFINVLIGFVLALSAYLIVTILVSVLLSGTFPREFLFINIDRGSSGP